MVQRWRHTVSVDWEQGPFSATLSNSYLSGYRDQEVVGKANRNVEAYSLWNLSAGWRRPSRCLCAWVCKTCSTSRRRSRSRPTSSVRLRPQLHRHRGRYGYASLRYTFR